ncbi:MAG: adenylyl-sulfate kinase [Gemmatimonadetes bacterium]|nr:MAG: adenylyl-sulfate kinase [Gemmatimonadota bacterium]
MRPATVADAHAILYAALDDKSWSRSEPVPTAGRVVWITGLSGTGKSTLGRAVAAAMRTKGRQVALLDGDELRAVIAGKVGHTEEERRELAFRYGSICRFLSSEGVDVVCATMSLFHACQEWNRKNIPGYIEVYLKVSLPKLVVRDPKGLYGRALRGEISNVAGVDLSYEEPLAPDLMIDNDIDREEMTPLVEHILALVERKR